MSYIRCLSNPEGLYIYDCMLGPANKQEHFVVISDGDNITIPYTVPFKTFEGLLRKYQKWNIGKDGHFEYKGLSLNIGSLDNFRYVLSYRDWSVKMWEVTWEHIARDRSLPYKVQKQNKLIKKLRARIKELE